jgi:glycosyltransferase involved in cell wall biosynthesis
VVTGYVDDVRPVVREAGVYVVPLRVGGGTRLKVLDAMAMGRAIVSTSVGCEGIAAKDGEHLVVADSPMRFADAVLELLADPDRRRRLGHAARSLVERRYSWPIVGGLLRSAYEEAIHARRRPA